MISIVDHKDKIKCNQNTEGIAITKRIYCTLKGGLRVSLYYYYHFESEEGGYVWCYSHYLDLKYPNSAVNKIILFRTDKNKNFCF